MSNNKANPRPSSIQASNLDLKALGDALTDSPIQDDSPNQKGKTKHEVSEAEPYSLGEDEDDEEGEEQVKGSDSKDKDSKKVDSKVNDKKKEGKDSPETLSPDSSPLKKDVKPLEVGDEKSNSTSNPIQTKDEVAVGSKSDSNSLTAGRRPTSTSTPSNQQENRNGKKDSDQVEAIKNMFPNLDSETISAVLVGTNGDVDAAINHLLSMSDPNYVPPVPSETDSDAALARSLAAEEQIHSQRRSQPRPSGRGGSQPPSLGGWFGGQPQQQQQQQQKQQQPTYDPSALNYQPRQRKNPTSPGARAAYNSNHNQMPQAFRRDSDQRNPLTAGFPGSNEAKQWEESINKFAETGMAKAASTFAALRSRAAALASSPTSEGGPSNNSSTPSSTSGGGGGSFFSQLGLGGGQNNNTSSSSTGGGLNRRQSQNPRSPQSPYDRDPEPVGEDELARILARGQASRSNSTSSIGLGNGRNASSSTSSSGRNSWREKQEIDEDLDDVNGDDEDLWGSAGRVIDKKKKKPVGNEKHRDETSRDGDGKKEDFKPIEIKGATTTAASDDKNQNHGINHREDSDENDSDVEYVANPFEEDD